MDPSRFAADPLLADYAPLAEGPARMLVRRGYEAHAALLGLRGTPAADGGWAGGGREPHPVVVLPGGELAVVRAFRRGGAVRHLNRGRYFLGHRAWEELRAAEAARRGGVRTPLPLAATERRAALGYTAWLATLRVAEARDAAAWLGTAEPAQREAMLREAGTQVGRMHAAGVAHPDLNLRNLLVREAGDGAPEVLLLDWDRARVHAGPVPGRRRARDLRRLARSVRKLGSPIDAEGWAAFREGYGAGWPLPGGFLP
ncbi:MAG TPA: lipopolysaccharide kinase InaA family protein [Longimicrobiaceae bacterium]|nr:lipopolysaccharide kinase InaA family protein [Longimicrobiaceae bacterium]